MDVCAKLKGILGVKRIGHAGTLDPMAEGVLPVAVGRDTKDIDLVGNGIKEYKAGMLLGVETETEDITGSIISVNGKKTDKAAMDNSCSRQQALEEAVSGIDKAGLPSEEDVRAAILSFVGVYEQLTPKYSARKVNGKKLYEYARAGIEVERKKKTVEILGITIDSIDLPHVTFTVRCSKGTYIRTLCRDIGEKLGCGACMESLLRTRVGDFGLEDALRLDEISGLKDKGELDGVFRIIAPTAVAIGKFDGTHIGHQALLKELKKLADRNRLKTCVIMFRFAKSSVLSDTERKRKMYELGIDYCIELQFDDRMRNMSAEDFLEKILIGRYNMKAIAGGEDVSFGKDRRGNADFLREHAAEYGYSVHLIKKISIDLNKTAEDPGTQEYIADNGEVYKGEKDAELKTSSNLSEADTVISSTLLRAELIKGDMLHVTRLLGTPYAISGLVVHGRHIGTDRLSAPTLNIAVPRGLILPPNGVYAVNVIIYDGKTGAVKTSGRGIANLGVAPTVNGEDENGSLRLETHVFEDIGDCYGKDARVELCYFIRHERMFESISELKNQVFCSDIPEAKKYFDMT